MVRHISSGSSFEKNLPVAGPAAAMIVAGLIKEEMKIEIEVTARIGAAAS